MRGTRALLASIGVSVALVAAAALSLFTVSVVIAFGGWSAGMGESAPPTALVFAGGAPTQPRDGKARHAAKPVVLRAPARSRPRRAASVRARTASRTVRGADAVVRRPVAAQAPAVTPPAVHSPDPAPAPAPAATRAPTPKTGDGVRRVGTGLSSTVQSVGKGLSDVTTPLAPPVGSAVQHVVDLVAAVLQHTTDGLGATLDKTLP
jgi:hypothetical protein